MRSVKACFFFGLLSMAVAKSYPTIMDRKIPGKFKLNINFIDNKLIKN